MTQEEIIEEIKKMDAVQLNELAKALQEAFGIEAAMPVAVGTAPTAAATEAAAPAVEEEQTEFDAVLTVVGDNRVPVIKVVREITGLSLKEAKELADKAPVPIKEKIPQQEAEDIKNKLSEVGATVEVK